VRHARGLTRTALADGHDVVEGVGDLAVDTRQILGHAHVELTVSKRQHCRQQRARERVRVAAGEWHAIARHHRRLRVRKLHAIPLQIGK
jgi:hypothetical protein